MDILRIPSISDQADFLKIHAHCLGYKITDTKKEKYYIYDHLDYNTGTISSYGFIVYYERKKKNKDYLPVSKRIAKGKKILCWTIRNEEDEQKVLKFVDGYVFENITPTLK